MTSYYLSFQKKSSTAPWTIKGHCEPTQALNQQYAIRFQSERHFTNHIGANSVVVLQFSKNCWFIIWCRVLQQGKWSGYTLGHDRSIVYVQPIWQTIVRSQDALQRFDREKGESSCYLATQRCRILTVTHAIILNITQEKKNKPLPNFRLFCMKKIYMILHNPEFLE